MFNIALRKRIKVLAVTCVLYGFSIPSALAVTTVGTNINTSGNVTLSAGNLTVTTGTLTVGGNVSLSGGADISLIPVSNGNVTIGGAVQSGTIFIGTSTVTNSINIGNAITEAGFTQTVNIGSGVTTAGAATAIAIGNSTVGTTTINIGAANNGNLLGKSVVSIGSAQNASALTLAAGTGNMSLNGTTSSTLTLGSGITTGALNLGSSLTTGAVTIGTAAQTGSIFIGTSTATNKIEIGNGITAASNIQTINIGAAGAANSTTTIGIGSGSGTSAITIGNTSGASSAAINTSDWKVSTTGLMQGIGDINSDGNFNTSATTFNIANGTSTTINMGGAATTINFGNGFFTLGSSTKLATMVGTTTISGSVGIGTTSVTIVTSPLTVTSDNRSNIRIDMLKRTGPGYHSNSIHTDLDGALDLVMNAYLDNYPAQWNRYDTSRAASVWNMDSYGDAVYYWSEAGANPITDQFVGGRIKLGRSNGYPEITTLHAEPLVFQTSSVVNTPIEVMRLTTGQRVGIGTTTPAYKLHVTGDIYASGNIICGGSCWTATGSDVYFNTGNVGIGATPTHKFHEVAGTLTDSVSAMYVSATMPTTISAEKYAVNYQITGAGSSAINNIAMNVDYIAGYTGGNFTAAFRAANATAGTGATVFDSLMNAGLVGNAYATATGTNVGFWGNGNGGNINYGGFAKAITLKNSATNIGFAAFGRNTGSSPTQVGGFFGLNSSVPTYASAALMADNSDQTSNIFVARDNGTAVFTIGDVASTHAVNLAAGTLTSGYSAMYVSATMPTTITGANYATNFQITSAGSSVQVNTAMNIDYLAGYTGAYQTAGLRVSNVVAGQGTSIIDSIANIGVIASATATTIGQNTGGWFSASGGNTNYGFYARSIAAKNGATNIGIVAVGNNSGSTPTQVGGYFGLNSATPTFTSAALMADNSDQTSPIFVARDNGTAIFTIGDVATTHAVAIAGGSILDTKNILNITGTVTSSTSNNAGVLANITSAGSGASYISGMTISLLAGYTGTKVSRAMELGNYAAGTGNNLKFDTEFANPEGNSGQNIFVSSTTTGTNIGSYVEARLGDLNIGVIGKATTAKASTTNIGVIGIGLNTNGTSPIQVGGYFGLQAATPTFASAALMADNGATTSNIFVARDNGTAVFTIADGGKASLGTSTAPTYAMDVFSTGTTTALLDSVSTTQGGCLLMQDTANNTLYGIVITNGVLGTTTAANCT